jgi:hypothetical protein
MTQFAYFVPWLFKYRRLKFFSFTVFEGVPVVDASHHLDLYSDHITYLPILKVGLSLELLPHEFLNIFEWMFLCVF